MDLSSNIKTVTDYLLDIRTLKQILIGSATYVTIRVILFVYNRYKTFQTFKKLGIPGPKPNLLDGNLSEFLKEKAYFKITQKWRERYGKVFGYYIGDVPHLIIVDPGLIRKFLVDNPTIFTARSKLYIETKPVCDSVLFNGGDRWRSMRKTLTPAFSQYRMKGDDATKFIDDSVASMISYLANKHKVCKANNQPTTVDIMELMKSTSLHLITNMAIKIDGVKIQEDAKYVKILDDYLHKADSAVVYWAIRFPILQPVCSFIATNFSLASILNEIFANLESSMENLLKDKSNKKKSRHHNIFEQMVELHREGQLTHSEVLGNSAAILFAGYDTTATTLSYFFWIVSKYPDIQEKLRTDIISRGSESPYLKMVLNETMRLYPTVQSFTKRIASKDITIDGLTVKKGVQVVVDSWLLHRDPDIWPDPLKFIPERFVDMSKIDPCAFVPFGVGQRLCLGYQLATLEMKLIATELLMTYKFSLNGPDVLDLVSSATVLTTPLNTIRLDLQPLYTR